MMFYNKILTASAVGSILFFVFAHVSASTNDDKILKSINLWEGNAEYCGYKPQPPQNCGIRNNAKQQDLPKECLFPTKEGCDDGDMTLFNGLLCLSGDERGCRAVQDAQRLDGSWRRSPRLANQPELRKSDFFSPDMAIGVQLWVAKKQDQNAKNRFAKWVNWLQSHQVCKGKNCENNHYIVVCTDASDNGCDLGAGGTAMLGATIRALNIEDSITDRHFREFLINKSEEAINWVWAEANTNRSGFSLNLVGASILLLKELRLADPHNLISSAQRALVDRTLDAEGKPSNPFFLYLQYGRDRRVLDLVYRLCPSESSQIMRKTEWAWEREPSNEAWRNSMLWDCIFMTNLLGIKK